MQVRSYFCQQSVDCIRTKSKDDKELITPVGLQHLFHKKRHFADLITNPTYQKSDLQLAQYLSDEFLPCPTYTLASISRELICPCVPTQEQKHSAIGSIPAKIFGQVLFSTLRHPLPLTRNTHIKYKHCCLSFCLTHCAHKGSSSDFSVCYRRAEEYQPP